MEKTIYIEGKDQTSLSVDPDKVFFTSDTHFSHTNIIKYQDRPFKDVIEMNEHMIRMWNEVVPWDGHVFHLGDVAFGDERSAKSTLDRLNGSIYLVKGNHDKTVLRKEFVRDRFVWVKEKYVVKFDKGKGDEITLCHFAHRVWNKSHHGAYHLYGHSHGAMEDTPWGRSMDVGVDVWDFKPISLKQVCDVLSERKFKVADHHIEKL